MGGKTSSIAKNEVDLSAATSLIVNNIMNCKNNAYITQKLNLSGSHIVLENIKQTQAYKLDVSCSQKLETSADLKNKVAAAVAGAAEAKSPGILSVLTSTGSNINTVIRQQISDYFENKNISNLVSTINAEQGMDISGKYVVIKNYTQEQTFDLLQKNIQDSLSKVQIVKDINDSLNADVKATTTNPISDLIDSIFGGLGNLSLILGVIFIVVLFVCVTFFKEPILAFLGMKADDRSQPPPPGYYSSAPGYSQQPPVGYY
jgi:hypothetical protein